MVANNIDFYNDIIKATVRVMKKRGFSCRGSKHQHNPYYQWGGGNHPNWDESRHHMLEHPIYGLIIYRGFFYDLFASNTKDIDKKKLKDDWESDLEKYDNFVLQILYESIIKVMTKHCRFKLYISFSSDSFKVLDKNETKSLKGYTICNYQTL